MSGNSEDETLTPDDLTELLELQRVVFFEISARRWNSDPNAEDREDPPDQNHTNLQVLHKLSEDSLSTRCRLTLSYREGIIVVDAAANFGARDKEASIDEAAIDEDTIAAFSEQVAIPLLFPYLREASQETARRVRMKAPLLHLIRPGSIKLQRGEIGSSNDR